MPQASTSHAGRLFVLTLLAGLLLPLPAAAQQKGRVVLSFSRALERVEASPAELEATLKAHTRVGAATNTPAQLVFVYGIARGDEVGRPHVSGYVTLSPKAPRLTTRRGAPLDSPWEAFDDPLTGFEDPLVGFEDPLVGFGTSTRMVVNHEEQYDTPEAALDAIWGVGGTFVEPGAYGLVLFSMSLDAEGAFVTHGAAIVSFRVQERSRAECTKKDPCGQIRLGFSPSISGVRTDLRGLETVLKEHTQLEASAPKKAAKMAFVYGIGHGDKVYGPYVSGKVVLTPGTSKLVGKGKGFITSPWEAFDDPLTGFEDPLVGFEDPLVGFEDPLVGLDTIWGVGGTFTDPAAALDAIWGVGGTFVEPGAYGLVLFSVSLDERGARVVHQGALVPFRVEAGGRTAAEAAAAPEAAPGEAALEGAYPNPFNPQTTIRYALPVAQHVRLAVFDVLGREVALLANGVQDAGVQAVTFEARHLPSGVYFVRLQAGMAARTHRITLMK